METASVDWAAFASDVKLLGRMTRPKHIKEAFDFSQSTTMAVWQGKSIGLVPYLRICKWLQMNPLKYLTE